MVFWPSLILINHQTYKQTSARLLTNNFYKRLFENFKCVYLISKIVDILSPILHLRLSYFIFQHKNLMIMNDEGILRRMTLKIQKRETTHHSFSKNAILSVLRVSKKVTTCQHFVQKSQAKTQEGFKKWHKKRPIILSFI